MPYQAGPLLRREVETIGQTEPDEEKGLARKGQPAVPPLLPVGEGDRQVATVGLVARVLVGLAGAVGGEETHPQAATVALASNQLVHRVQPAEGLGDRRSGRVRAAQVERAAPDVGSLGDVIGRGTGHGVAKQEEIEGPIVVAADDLGHGTRRALALLALLDEALVERRGAPGSAGSFQEGLYRVVRCCRRCGDLGGGES